VKIAILSDSHSRYHTVEAALGILQTRNINTLIHCGDIDDAEAIWLFQGFTAHFVWGNCDTERASMQQAIHGIGGTLHGAWGFLELNDVKLGFTHGDNSNLLHDLEQSGKLDYLFYGHTHIAKEHLIGTTRVINPGALHRARPRTMLVLDLATGHTESVVVGQ
jgi:putative phosphoesterase